MRSGEREVGCTEEFGSVHTEKWRTHGWRALKRRTAERNCAADGSARGSR